MDFISVIVVTVYVCMDVGMDVYLAITIRPTPLCLTHSPLKPIESYTLASDDIQDDLIAVGIAQRPDLPDGDETEIQPHSQ